MIQPDIIISWPKNCDFPLWRQYIHDNRTRFNEIIIVFTETHQGDDYRQFVRDATFQDHVLCIENLPLGSNDDWRNVAIHSALLHSYNASHILFMEQDFLIQDPVFWEMVERYQDYDAIGVMEGTWRRHPCFLIMERKALHRTQMQFGVVKDKLDHFGLIQKDMENVDNHITFTAIPDRVVGPYDNQVHENIWYHMAGLSHNLSLVYSGQKPNRDVDIFNDYIKKCLEVTVQQSPVFNKMAQEYLTRV